MERALLPFRQQKIEAEVVRRCNTYFNKAQSERLQFEPQWYLNLAFYGGKQYVQWQKGLSGKPGRLFEPAVPHWRVRAVINKIKPIIRAEIAKVTQEKPQAYAIPSSSDEEDLAAARMAEAAFDYLWRELKLNRIMRRAEFWTMTCGTGFIKDFYDKDMVDSSGIKGAIRAEAVSPFHLFVPDLQEQEIENQPYVIHSLAKDPEWVEMRYGVRIAPDSIAGGELLEQKFLSAIGISTVPKKFVAVKEAWIKPNPHFKEGAHVVWAGDQILSLTEGWLYNHGEYPFTKLEHIPTGRFYTDSTIVDLIPLQKELNRTRSQIIEAKNRMAKPQLVAAKGSVEVNKMTTEPGLVIEYNPGFQPPQPLPLQNLPSYVVQEVERIQVDMDDISSQHEVTKGRTPPGVTAATAIAYLQEQDDSKLSNTIGSLEEGVEKVGRHMLSHIQQFWTAERKIKVIGEDNTVEAYMLSQANIRGGTDIYVEAGSAMPRSRAAKQAFIMELGERGWINGDQGLKYLGLVETGKLYEEIRIDARQAQREHVKMMAGMPVPVNDWDNHEAHILEHNNFRKKQKFENLSDEIKILFEEHVQAHKMILMGQPMEMGGPEMLEEPSGQPAGPLSLGPPPGSVQQGAQSAPPGQF